MFKRLLLLAAFVLPLAFFQGTEAGGRWSFYVRNQRDGSLLRVYEDGEIQELDLGLAEGQIAYTNIAIYPNENLAAFCSIFPNEGNESAPVFHLRDLDSNIEVINIPLDSGDCNVSTHAFSTDGLRVSYGTSRGQNDWTLSILDTSTGELLHELTELPLEGENLFVMPNPLIFPGNTITFSMVPWGTEGRPDNEAFIWNLETGDIQRDNTFGKFKIDFLSATGELAWTDLDENRTAAQPGGPIPMSNVVRVRDDSGDVSDVYYNGEEVITGLRFIDNGQAIAVNLLGAFDMENPDDQVTRWVRVDRQGEVTEIAAIQIGYINVLPFRNGYAILIWSPTDGASLHTVIDGETTQLWAPEGTDQWGILPWDFNLPASNATTFTPID